MGIDREATPLLTNDLDRSVDDMALLRLYVETGSQHAFAELVARHHLRVHRTCRRALRGLDFADDATQLVFIALARRAPFLRVEVHIGGWLYRAARHVAADLRKHEARRQRRHQELAAHAILETVGYTGAQNEDQEYVQEMLAELAASDRRAIWLRYFEGLSVGEMADVLGLSYDGAKKRVGRALTRIRTSRAVRPSLLAAISAIFAAIRKPSIVKAIATACAKAVGSQTKFVQLIEEGWRILLKSLAASAARLTAARVATASAVVIAGALYGRKLPTAIPSVSRSLPTVASSAPTIQARQTASSARSSQRAGAFKSPRPSNPMRTHANVIDSSPVTSAANPAPLPPGGGQSVKVGWAGAAVSNAVRQTELPPPVVRRRPSPPPATPAVSVAISAPTSAAIAPSVLPTIKPARPLELVDTDSFQHPRVLVPPADLANLTMYDGAFGETTITLASPGSAGIAFFSFHNGDPSRDAFLGAFSPLHTFALRTSMQAPAYGASGLQAGGLAEGAVGILATQTADAEPMSVLSLAYPSGTLTPTLWSGDFGLTGGEELRSSPFALSIDASPMNLCSMSVAGEWQSDSVQTIPEPTALALALTIAIPLALRRRRRGR